MGSTQQDVQTFLVAWLSENLGRSIGNDATFAGLGLDSLDVVRLTDALAERLGVEELPVSIVLDHPSISALAAQLATVEATK